MDVSRLAFDFWRSKQWRYFRARWPAEWRSWEIALPKLRSFHQIRLLDVADPKNPKVLYEGAGKGLPEALGA